jgi:hypothetical protein
MRASSGGFGDGVFVALRWKRVAGLGVRAQRHVVYEPGQREGDQGYAGRSEEDGMQREGVRVDDGAVDLRAGTA